VPDFKFPNCLTKNLLESDSLPQLRNLLEISFTIASFGTGEGGERVAVNDGGAESSGESDGAAISAWVEEREAKDPGRVGGVDWLQSLLCAASRFSVEAMNRIWSTFSHEAIGFQGLISGGRP
jgi:hypothetical protein